MTTAPPVQNPTPNTTVAGKIALAALALTVVGWLIYIEFTGGLDFNVYRLGAMTIFDNEGMHKDLYARDLLDYGALKLPFTYPPFAALLFVPFAFLPFGVGVGIMYTISIGVAWWMATLIYDYATSRGYHIPFQDKLGRYGTIAVLTIIIILSGPWRRGLALVQVNPIILILVLADFLRPAKRIPRGALIGIAGGIKLTPLAFGLILLMRKDWRGVASVAGGFVGTIALGFLAVPGEAAYYWGVAVRNTSRIGVTAFYDNVSLTGIFAHQGVPEPIATVLVVALSLFLLVATAALMRLFIRANMVFSQVALNAFLMLQISPISWSHHNTWYPVLLVALCLEIFPLIMPAARPVVYVLSVFASVIALVGMYISPVWLAVLFSPQYSSHEMIYLPQGGAGLVAGSAPYAAMYLVVALVFLTYWAHRAAIDARVGSGRFRAPERPAP